LSDLTHSENSIQPVSDERRAELLFRVYSIILSPEWEIDAVTVPMINRSESDSEQVDVQNE
jgi:hypothetical protein